METLVGNQAPLHVSRLVRRVEKWGVLNDWHYAVGTGPFILEDLVRVNRRLLYGILIMGI